MCVTFDNLKNHLIQQVAPSTSHKIRMTFWNIKRDWLKKTAPFFISHPPYLQKYSPLWYKKNSNRNLLNSTVLHFCMQGLKIRLKTNTIQKYILEIHAMCWVRLCYCAWKHKPQFSQLNKGICFCTRTRVCNVGCEGGSSVA